MLAGVLVMVVALLLDRLLGEPRRWHPLVGFGRLAAAVEARINAGGRGGVASGVAALSLLVLPLTALAAVVYWLPPWLRLPLEVFGLYLALGLRSLGEHAEAVAKPLANGDLEAAREAVSAIVSRDAARLDESGVAAAATESVLENGADAVVASLFWFLLLGLPGVVLHRLVNTLDAMWGYRTPRYQRFGRCAARLDDLLNALPARVTALAYAAAPMNLSRARAAWRCWREQAPLWDSPNAGPVMASGAGALGVRLGGPAPYRERSKGGAADGWKSRPVLGEGDAPDAASIRAALRLLHRSVWGGVALLLAVALAVSTGAGA